MVFTEEDNLEIFEDMQKYRITLQAVLNSPIVPQVIKDAIKDRCPELNEKPKIIILPGKSK